MPEADIDRLYDYSPEYIADILRSVKTIAMVGASGDKTRFSYGVLRVLHETGYDMAPINPNPALTEIRGVKVYSSLAEVDRPIDMVQVFRRKEELYGIAEQAKQLDLEEAQRRCNPGPVGQRCNRGCIDVEYLRLRIVTMQKIQNEFVRIVRGE